LQHTDATIPVELNDGAYFREVLQLNEGSTEASFDDDLTREAEKLGITITKPHTPNQNPHDSLCQSAVTIASHRRTASWGSQGSNSTGITSTSSREHFDTFTRAQSRKRNSARRSLSFSEYEKYLGQMEKQNNSTPGLVPPPIPAEPAPSLFSVSSRRSYQSIRNGFKNRFRMRRKTPASRDDLK
jgi:hypothetical protein